MSKREPLLSDKTARFILADHGMDWRFSHRQVVIYTRDHYEKLIDEGKLRVVEEVRAIEKESFINCSGCGLSYPWEADALIGTIKYCPGCGNKIKR